MAKKANNKWTRRVKGLKNEIAIAPYAGHVFPILGSKSAALKAITGGRLLLNGKKANTKDVLKNGDVLHLTGSGVQKARSFTIEIDIVFEDDFLILVNKPAGIAVNGNRVKTVENALAGRAKKSDQSDALPRPVAVHRIDVPTKGLVMLAKTKSALIKMGKAFQENRVRKEYLAVVHGQPDNSGRIDQPVQGKSAITNFETLEVVPSRTFKHLALVRMQPLTGRTHQLRLHFQQRGHLIVGDKMYAKNLQTILGKGLFLFASRLQFEHPDTGEQLDIQLDPPARFSKLMQREKSRFG